MRSHKKLAFTFVELVAVISIIGVLFAILLPMVSSAMSDAKKLRDSRCMQQIAMSFSKFSLRNNAYELNSCQTTNEWAAVLSRNGELNLPEIFIFKDDYLVSMSGTPIPKSIGIVRDGRWEVNPEFKHFPTSVVIITRISSMAPATTTPIAYTRGLDRSTGRWRSDTGENGGVYGESGGLIVFLDGHVEFYSNLTDESNKLVNYYTGEKTSNISEAVNRGARAISWQGVEWEAN